MTRLEDVLNKSELVKEYYKWLLNSENINLEKELDLSLVQTYNDPYIYYPECMHDLFHAEKLQRLSRVSQLGSMFQYYPGAYHTRLAHSIGTFGKKQEEHIYLWQQNPEFVNYIESNGLKKYIIAEEIKMLYHDVGHLPFSHISEQELIGKKGIHEMIGMDILLTDPELSAIFSRLEISDELRTVLNQDVFNSSEHDDGNMDVDRKDFLQRDTLHIGGPCFGYYPIYTRKVAKINSDGTYQKSADGHIIFSESLETNSKFIDVYSYSDLSQIENFLNERQSQYDNKYYHSSTLATDTILGFVLKNLAPKNRNLCPDLVEYINFLKNHNYKSAAKYDDIRIYKSLINLALNSSDQNVIDTVSLLFVPFENWLENMYEQLDKIKDADFIKTIHKNLVKGNSRFAQNIKNPNFFNENVILVDGENSRELKRKGFFHLIYNSHSFSAYNSSFPIFIEDADGNTFALEEHPDRSRNWLDTRTYSQVAICIIPLLRLQGLSPFKIADYAKECRRLHTNTSIDSSLLPSINMKHLQTGHDITSYFELGEEDSLDDR